MSATPSKKFLRSSKVSNLKTICYTLLRRSYLVFFFKHCCLMWLIHACFSLRRLENASLPGLRTLHHPRYSSSGRTDKSLGFPCNRMVSWQLFILSLNLVSCNLTSSRFGMALVYLRLESYLRNYGRTLVIVSHDRSKFFWRIFCICFYTRDFSLLECNLHGHH